MPSARRLLLIIFYFDVLHVRHTVSSPWIKLLWDVCGLMFRSNLCRKLGNSSVRYRQISRSDCGTILGQRAVTKPKQVVNASPPWFSLVVSGVNSVHGECSGEIPSFESWTMVYFREFGKILHPPSRFCYLQGLLTEMHLEDLDWRSTVHTAHLIIIICQRFGRHLQARTDTGPVYDNRMVRRCFEIEKITLKF